MTSHTLASSQPGLPPLVRSFPFGSLVTAGGWHVVAVGLQLHCRAAARARRRDGECAEAGRPTWVYPAPAKNLGELRHCHTPRIASLEIWCQQPRECSWPSSVFLVGPTCLLWGFYRTAARRVLCRAWPSAGFGGPLVGSTWWPTVQAPPGVGDSQFLFADNPSALCFGDWILVVCCSNHYQKI